MDPAARLICALGAALALAALALLTWVAVRVESLRREVRRPPPEPEKCDRLHASDVYDRWLDARAPEPEHLLAAEDLPPFRGPVRRVVDEDEVNPTLPVHRR